MNAHRPDMGVENAERLSLRVGMIAMSDLDCPDYLSGMPHQMAKALRHQGIEIIPIPAYEQTGKPPSIPSRVRNRLRGIFYRRTAVQFRRSLDDLFPGRTRSAVLSHARFLSQTTQKNLDQLLEHGEQLDAIFGCCISTAMYDLNTNIPLFYFSDATSVLLRTSYPMFTSRGPSFRAALTEVEKTSVAKATQAVFASAITRQSAIADLGMDPIKTSVVAMGGNVFPNDPVTVVAPAEPPTQKKCELLIVAADPIRKQVDLATQATALLRQRGTNAVLHVIGPGTRLSNHSDAVEAVGPLRLSDPNDRARHQQLLRNCHLQLLPSLGEAYGIAPIESAHYARPSIVSSAGGLPFVVLDGRTGIVIDVKSDALTWAMAIESLIDDPDRYCMMSRLALMRARNEFNWSAWGQKISSLIVEQIMASQSEKYSPAEHATHLHFAPAEVHERDKA